jgi:hypothetical protein
MDSPDQIGGKRLDNQERKSRQEVTDTEFAQEVVSQPTDRAFSRDDDAEGTTRGYGWGIAGIVLSVLSFFLWPYLMAPLGIVLGVVSVSQRNSLGWWAIGIGVIALVLVTLFMIFAIPFRILF